MIEDPIEVTIGGAVLTLPVMPLYCLERAWPHIQRLGRMGLLNAAATTARRDLAMAAPDDMPARQAAVDAADAIIAADKADFIGQTHEALAVIVAALALSVPAPTYDDLSKRVRPEEIAGLHMACNLLMQSSGLIAGGGAPGEAVAARQPLSNGNASPLN